MTSRLSKYRCSRMRVRVLQLATRNWHINNGTSNFASRRHHGYCMRWQTSVYCRTVCLSGCRLLRRHNHQLTIADVSITNALRFDLQQTARLIVARASPWNQSHSPLLYEEQYLSSGDSTIGSSCRFAGELRYRATRRRGA